jgi:hypothetical protein
VNDVLGLECFLDGVLIPLVADSDANLENGFRGAEVVVLVGEILDHGEFVIEDLLPFHRLVGEVQLLKSREIREGAGSQGRVGVDWGVAVLGDVDLGVHGGHVDARDVLGLVLGLFFHLVVPFIVHLGVLALLIAVILVTVLFLVLFLSVSVITVAAIIILAVLAFVVLFLGPIVALVAFFVPLVVLVCLFGHLVVHFLHFRSRTRGFF